MPMFAAADASRQRREESEQGRQTARGRRAKRWRGWASASDNASAAQAFEQTRQFGFDLTLMRAVSEWTCVCVSMWHLQRLHCCSCRCCCDVAGAVCCRCRSVWQRQNVHRASLECAVNVSKRSDLKLIIFWNVKASETVWKWAIKVQPKPYLINYENCEKIHVPANINDSSNLRTWVVLNISKNI